MCHKGDMADTTYRERILAKQLESHEFNGGITSKPLEIPQVNFTIPLEKKIQTLSGPPYYMLRSRQIERLMDQLMEELSAEYSKMLAKFAGRREVFAGKWKKLIENWPLDKLNNLIEKHNMYYPIEANLRMNPRSSDFLFGSAVWKPREKITVESLLERFPPDASPGVV
jgi:hypothetical protein